MTTTHPQGKLLLHDSDGSPLAWVTRDTAERWSPGCVETKDGRLLHKDSVEAARNARNTDFWASVEAMEEPEGIRSDDSRPRWPATLTTAGSRVR
jgi:hypothetical protein